MQHAQVVSIDKAKTDESNEFMECRINDQIEKLDMWCAALERLRNDREMDGLVSTQLIEQLRINMVNSKYGLKKLKGDV